ncbi:hypothetical protein C8R45DRAFT_1075423 [Mycena sanguinolenta]|nr:hypothetical protein C8R45DRAFT_1075423 [Mycena sanguinolenta]
MFSDLQTMNNYINGGMGGTGGDGHRNGTGGAGGDGMGPSVNFDIRPGGSFTMNNAFQKGEIGLYVLHGAVAAAAIYDSAESYPQPKCHPETRTEMLEDLRDWALDEDAEQRILWLHGPAGAGKSAIMQTLAHLLDDAGRLGGCFFFKRGDPTRGNGKTLFATIAYQLALHVPWLRPHISQIVEDDPSIVRRTIETQMKKLIAEPCRSLHDSRENDAHVTVLVDGLDECEQHGVQQEILRAIQIASSQSPIFLRFIVASRPEPHIREVFESPVYSEILRSVNVEQSFDDVEKYLCDEFGRIHCEHSSMAHIPLPWPSPDIVRKLVQKSSGYFIYASTIIKFIDDKSYLPTQRLALVLDGNSTGSESPFDALDQLYITVICSAPRQSGFMPILCIMAAYSETVSTIEELLSLERGEIKLLLRGLHSVVAVYSDYYGQDMIKSHHASFLDFLNNANRSQKFYVGSLQNQMHLARCFLHFTAGHYRSKYLDHWRSPDLAPFPSQEYVRHGSLTKHNFTYVFGRIVNRKLIPLITSLPPSTELCPLIGRINPEHIFNIGPEYIFNLESNLEDMVSWLKKIPSAPHDLIKLWEDYVFMHCLQGFQDNAQIQAHSKISRESEPIIVSPSHEITKVAVVMVFLGIPFWRVPTYTGITWDELRATICSIRPIISKYDQGPPMMKILLQLFPRESYSWASRDVALRLIPTLRKNPLSESVTVAARKLWEEFPLLVRLCPPCPELYRELWSIPIPSSGWIGEELIYHVTMWLESFPQGPTMELIAFWRSRRTPEADGKYYVALLGLINFMREDELRKRVGRWNNTITRLDLPDDLKFPTILF